MRDRRCLVAGGLLLVSSCQLPKDPDGTLGRVQGGELRAGITEQPPWTDRAGSDAAGLEAEMVQEFASELGAKVVWVWGSEHRLLGALERRELDLVVGGLTDDTPYKSRVGLTKPYLENQRMVEERNEPRTLNERHVMAVAPGENGFLRRLEQFLWQWRQTMHEGLEPGR